MIVVAIGGVVVGPEPSVDVGRVEMTPAATVVDGEEASVRLWGPSSSFFGLHENLFFALDNSPMLFESRLLV